MWRIALAVTSMCYMAYGQAAEPKPVFEVATLKPSPPPDGRGMRVACSGGPGSPDPGRWSCQNMSLSNMITNAYTLKHYEISNPAWLDGERFEITAKIPEGTTKEQFRVMQQNLLEERFKLVFHREKKEVAGYELVVAKNGPKLTEAVEQLKADGAPPPPPGPLQLDKDGYPKLTEGMSMAIMNGRARWNAPKFTAEMIAGMLGGQLAKPVVDATGLKGKYDVSLFWNAGGLRGGPPPPPPGGGAVPEASTPDDSGPTLFSALQDQLGLKLESKKITIDVLVVDKIEKVPTEN